jgi:hypothetical protein
MRKVRISLLAALLVGIAAVTLINEIGISRYPPTGVFSDGAVRGFFPDDVRSCMGARALAAVGDRTSQWHWHHCAWTLVQTQALSSFDLRYWSLMLAGAFTLASALGFALALRFDRSSARVVRGRQLLTGTTARRAFVRTSRQESRLSGTGLEFLPGLTISRERETRHWLIWGSVGAGKTQTMLHLILAAMERGDGVLVLDVKGDMMAKLPGEPLLVAPQDQRSLVWHVASDCRTKQDARELAARLIPRSEDPVWSDAARETLVTCVSALQATKPERWSWHDLHEIATVDAERLLNLAKTYHLDAVRLLQNPESRTTQSVLSTFQAHMHVVAALGDAWRHNANGIFSVARWLARPMPHRPVILQHDPRYPELSHAWIGGLLAMLASAVGSPSLQESRERRIWIFADEFPQLPRLNHFSTFLDLGRSKGIITVIGAQDIAQLRATYGHERADAWVGMIGTKIITQLNAGRGAEEASQLIGDQEIERVERSETVVGVQASTTTMVRREMRRAVTAAEIATRLGPRDDGIRVLVLGQGPDALELTVPYVTLPERRPAHVAAAWVSKAARLEPAPQRPGQLRLVRPLPKATAERIREMGE